MSSFKQRVALMNSLCRICGQEGKNYISVFSESGKKQEIEKKIRHCLPLIIEEGDTLPKQICLVCLHKLDATWELVQLCKNGQVLIEKRLHDISENNNQEKVDDIICPLCHMEVQEDQLGVGCDGPCLRWFHCSCLKMPNEEYLKLANNQSEIWICFLCKHGSAVTNQVFYKNVNTIDEKVRSLSEDQPITIGGSAVITLVPVEEPSPPQEAPPSTTMAPVTSEGVVGMVPTYQVSAPTTIAAPTTMSSPTSVDNNVYPQGLIQVLPSKKPVLYQQQSSNVAKTPVRRNIVTPTKRTPASKSSVANSPRPNILPQRSVPTASKRASKEGNSSSLPAPKRVLIMCKYCKKSFPDEIIDHHVSLHLRQSFFTCLDCNKNFRSEMAMSRHRCGTTDSSTNDTSTDNSTIDVSIDLDPDDDLICL